MARRNDHNREQLRELILEASWDIVAQEGLGALTARRIASRVGYAAGTIYNIYDSMEGLYIHLNAKTINLLLATLNDPSCNDKNLEPVDNMKCMAMAYMNFAREYKNHWLMLFTLNVTNKSGEEWYHKKVEELFIPLENQLISFFKEEQLKELHMATRLLWSSVHGLCFLQQTNKISIVESKSNSEDVVNYLIENFVAGLKINNK